MGLRSHCPGPSGAEGEVPTWEAPGLLLRGPPHPPGRCPGRPDRRLPGGSPYSHQFKAVLLKVLGAEVDVLGRWVPQALPAGVQSLAVGQPQTSPWVVFLGKPAGPRARERDGKVRPGSYRPRTSSEPCPRADQEAEAPREIQVHSASSRSADAAETRSRGPSPARPGPHPSPAPIAKARARRRDGRMRKGPSARRRARALTCGKRCRDCASRACPVCSSRRRSSDAASGAEAGARSRRRPEPRPSPYSGGPGLASLPRPTSPSSAPARYSDSSPALTVSPLRRRRGLARFGSPRKSVP